MSTINDYEPQSECEELGEHRASAVVKYSDGSWKCTACGFDSLRHRMWELKSPLTRRPISKTFTSGRQA